MKYMYVLALVWILLLSNDLTHAKEINSNEINVITSPQIYDHSGFDLDRYNSTKDSFDIFPVVPLVPILSKTKGYDGSYLLGYQIPMEILQKYYPALTYFTQSENRFIIRNSNAIVDSLPNGLKWLIRKENLMAIAREGKLLLIKQTTKEGFHISRSKGLNLRISSEAISLDLNPFSYGESFDVVNFKEILEKMTANFKGTFKSDINEDLVKADQLVYEMQNYVQVMLEAQKDMKSLLKAEINKNFIIERGGFVQENEASVFEQNAINKLLYKKVSQLKKEYFDQAELRKLVQNFSNNEIIWNNQQANQLVQSVCDQFSKLLDLPQEIHPKCRVAASMVPNAYALPGGDIFITAGLLGVISNLDTLVYVIGHELGHVVAKHYSQKQRFHQIYKIGMSGLGLASNLFVLNKGVESAAHLSFIPWAQNNMVNHLGHQASNRIINYASLMGVMAHSREQETEADQLGLEMALAYGVSLENLEEGMKEYNSFFENHFSKNKNIFVSILREHPSDKERSKKLKERIKKYKNMQRKIEDDVVSEKYQKIHGFLKLRVENWLLSMKTKDKLKSYDQNSFSQQLIKSQFSAGSRCQGSWLTH